MTTYYSVAYKRPNEPWRDNYPNKPQRSRACGSVDGFATYQAAVEHADKLGARFGYSDTMYAAIKLPWDGHTLQSAEPRDTVTQSAQPFSGFYGFKAIEVDKLAEAKRLAKELTDTELVELRTVLRDEWFCRRQQANKEAADRAVETKYEECKPALASLFLNVAHAMACRMALRWLKGHDPVGKQPQHGAMWTPVEAAELGRRVTMQLPPLVRTEKNQDTRLRANPLLWRTEADIKGALKHGLFSDYSSYRDGHAPWSTSY